MSEHQRRCRSDDRRTRRVRAGVLLVALALLVGCGEKHAPAVTEGAASEPVGAVLLLIGDLRRNDLSGYARHALPPALHARVQTAWREGRTRWPLTELPLESRLPGLIAALAAPAAEHALLATYQRQFAGADSELHSSAKTLGLFGTQYLRREGDYSQDERDHYVHLVGALSRWGQRAPLGDRRRAANAIPQLVAAARLTGLAGPDRFAELGMERSLGRFGPFFARFKQVLVGYGLDLDADLAQIQASVVEQGGEEARVRLRYRLAGTPIDAVVRVRRIDGRWYLTDAVRHAEAQAALPAADASTGNATMPRSRRAPQPGAAVAAGSH